jgi:glycolate oxidase
VPVYGGIVLSLERMNHILEVDQENMMAVVEPGVVTNDINERLAPVGLFYAGYPMSLETCYIGGNVAENAGGGKAVKYGVTERYVLGLQVVTPTGEIVELGGKRVKDVTGYNLLKLMVGSEGTLCVITRVTLRLLPLPRNQVALLVPFADVPSAIAAVPRIMTQAGVIPAAIEFMDRLSVHTSCRYLNEQLPYEQAGAMLLIEVDGSDEETVRRDYESIGELCLECGAQEVYVADNHTTRERLWRIRRNIAEAFKAASPHQSLEDIVVPPAAIPRIMPELERIAGRYGVQIPCYGHAGDGNLHATVVRSPEDSMEAWRGKLPQVLTELYLAARALGGTISGEHGIGSKRKEFMRLVASEAELDMMRRIKRALDPNNILNPGKIFDA